MDPEKAKKNSDKNKDGSENDSNDINTGKNPCNEKDPETRESEKKIKRDWDDREIDFDQLIF